MVLQSPLRAIYLSEVYSLQAAQRWNKHWWEESEYRNRAELTPRERASLCVFVCKQIKRRWIDGTTSVV